MSPSNESTISQANDKKNNKKIKEKESQPHRSPPKQYFKLVIRQLPAVDYAQEKFSQRFEEICTILEIPKTSYKLLHFIQGKLSQSRGLLGSVGYVSFDDEEFLKRFLNNIPSKIIFLTEEEYAEHQPQMIRAIYHKSTKFSFKSDKLNGTHTADPEYIEFLNKTENPISKRVSAELQLEKLEKAAAASAVLNSQNNSNNQTSNINM